MIYYKPPEVINFENATGIIFTDQFLRCRTNENVEIRDLFIHLNVKEKSCKEYQRVANLINKNRTTINASVKRFYNLYQNDKYYRKKVDELKVKITGQLELFQ